MMNCNHYHRTWAEISLDAVEQNIANLRAWIPAGCKLMCVIKADGYGHGAAALASFLQEKCDYFAVSVLEEALTLRAQGVIKPILLLCYTSPSQYDAVARAGLAQTICSLETARALSEAAQKHGKTLRIHIAVDTGMNRVGFADTDASVEDIRRIAALPGLACEGIFSHFARADERETEASLGQYRRFDAFLAKLEAAGLRIPLRHICNSAGTMQLPRHYDMVRVGIAMYGLYPSDETDRAVPLTPAMQWKTHVAQLKTVPAGQGISYGHTFVTTRPTRVATLPVGYADGYPRALSNCGQVIVRGKYAPILGRVCMDLCMVDVTDIPGVEMEDEVILVGESGGCRVTLEEIGAASASFNYEAACRVSQRVPRRFLYHGEVVDFSSVFVTAEKYLAELSCHNGPHLI